MRVPIREVFVIESQQAGSFSMMHTKRASRTVSRPITPEAEWIAYYRLKRCTAQFLRTLGDPKTVLIGRPCRPIRRMRQPAAGCRLERSCQCRFHQSPSSGGCSPAAKHSESNLGKHRQPGVPDRCWQARLNGTSTPGRAARQSVSDR